MSAVIVVPCNGPGIMRYAVKSPAGLVEAFTISEHVAHDVAALINRRQAVGAELSRAGMDQDGRSGGIAAELERSARGENTR